MKIWKFKKEIDVEKSIGNLRLETFNYVSYENGKRKNWSELHLWYDNDCEYCPCCWEDKSYEGECYDCGCYLAKKKREEAPIIICMLPDWIKNMLMWLRGIRR